MLPRVSRAPQGTFPRLEAQVARFAKVDITQARLKLNACLVTTAKFRHKGVRVAPPALLGITYTTRHHARNVLAVRSHLINLLVARSALEENMPAQMGHRAFLAPLVTFRQLEMRFVHLAPPDIMSIARQHVRNVRLGVFLHPLVSVAKFAAKDITSKTRACVRLVRVEACLFRAA